MTQERLERIEEARTRALPDDSFGFWLSGLCDGEASFSLSASKRSKTIDGILYISRDVDLRLVISLRSDDKPLLEMIHETMKVGVIGNRGIRKKFGTMGYVNRPASHWIVSNLTDIVYMKQFFQRFPLRSKKARDVVFWSRAIELKIMALENKMNYGTRSAKPWTDEMWAEIEQLDQTVKELRKYKEVV